MKKSLEDQRMVSSLAAQTGHGVNGAKVMENRETAREQIKKGEWSLIMRLTH